jgi:hypothetical protein
MLPVMLKMNIYQMVHLYAVLSSVLGGAICLWLSKKVMRTRESEGPDLKTALAVLAYCLFVLSLIYGVRLALYWEDVDSFFL